MLLIRRELVKIDYLARLGTKDSYKAKFEALAAALDDAPFVDAEPVRYGKWKIMGECGVTECSVCKWSIEEYVGDYKYCPFCGAKMD